MKRLIVIAGPTASGKTALAVQLAKQLHCAVLSADSRQFYKEMNIGTAKPSLSEMDGIPHFFIGSHSIHEAVTAADFEKQALQVLENEFLKGDQAILVGGSGMFIDALCEGLDEIPNSLELRETLNGEFQQFGLEKLLVELKEKDPLFYAVVDQKNPVRVIRALEAIRLTGKPFTELRLKTGKKRNFEIERFVIDLPREVLYERINLRVEHMMQAGLLEEVKTLAAFKHLQTLNTVGYSELIDYLEGTIDLDRAIELIKQNSRRYAKRQLTWFRRNEVAHWLKSQTTEAQLTEIIQYLNAFVSGRA